MSVSVYPFQLPAAQAQLKALLEHKRVLNGSDTGIGKTYISAWSADELALPTLAIVPKSVIDSWTGVMKMATRVPRLKIINWEALKTGKHGYWRDGQWQFQEPHHVIVDEIHRGASGMNSQITQMVGMLAGYDMPLLFMSATAATTPMNMRALGFVFGLHQYNKSSFYRFCCDHGCHWSGPLGMQKLEQYKGIRGQEGMLRIRQALGERFIRLTVADAPGFPSTFIAAKQFDLGKEATGELQELYAQYEGYAKAKTKNVAHELALITNARHVSEIRKVPLIAEHARELVEQGKSAAIFVNFRDVVEMLQKELRDLPVSTIWGGQSQEERDSEKARFQNNDTTVCICTSDAGGVGIGLHDLKQERPRGSLICPSWKADVMKQVLGRIWRMNGTPSTQLIMTAAGTIEERVYKAFMNKFMNLSAFNNEEIKKNIELITDGDITGIAA